MRNSTAAPLRVAITGGARGIGRATAAAFVRGGAQVAIGDLDGVLAVATAGELGDAVTGFTVDVTDRSSVEAFVAGAEALLGPLDVFVNNAGIMPTGPFLEETDQVADLQIAVNLRGVLFGMKAALPSMVARGGGHVVNVASGAGKIGFPGGVTYCGTKHAVVGMTEAARSEFRAAGVAFHVVMPAIVKTDLTSGMHEARGVRSSTPEDVADAIVDAVRTGRVDVYVPRVVGLMSRTMPLMPRAVRDGLLKVSGGQRGLLDMDENARLAYRRRIAGTLPGSERPKTKA